MSNSHAQIKTLTQVDRDHQLAYLPRHQRWYNRIRRGLLAFLPWLAVVDDGLVQDYLTQHEYALFASMDVRDQQHACWVATALLRYVSDASEELIAAALLHDVGKADVPFWPLERIFVHVVAGVYRYQPAITPKHRGWRGAWQRKCHHELYGAQMIRQIGGRAQVAAIIEATRHVALQRPYDVTSHVVTSHVDISEIDRAAYLLKHVDQCF